MMEIQSKCSTKAREHFPDEEGKMQISSISCWLNRSFGKHCQHFHLHSRIFELQLQENHFKGFSEMRISNHGEQASVMPQAQESFFDVAR